MAIPFLTGQRLTADLLNDNVYDYFPSTTTKTTGTSRASTTTLADDPELSGIALGVGTWEVDFSGFFHTTTGGTQGIKTRWAFTGTWGGSTGIRACVGPGSGNTAATNDALTVYTRGNTLDATDAVYQANASSAFTQIRETSQTVVVTVAGNLSIQWAQNASSANPTVLDATSTVTIRKISA